MRSVYIWCFCQWVGEEAEGKYSGNGDYDYDHYSDCECDCVIEWSWGAKIAYSGCMLVIGGQNSAEWISCRCFLYGYS